MDSFELNKVMAFTFMSYFTSVLQPMVGEFKRKLQRFVLMWRGWDKQNRGKRLE